MQQPIVQYLYGMFRLSTIEIDRRFLRKYIYSFYCMHIIAGTRPDAAVMANYSLSHLNFLQP